MSDAVSRCGSLRHPPLQRRPLLRTGGTLLPALDSNRACGARCQRYRLTAKSIQRLDGAKGAVRAGVGGLSPRLCAWHVFSARAWDWEAHSAPLGLFVRGHMLMMQPAFAVVFWCGPERQQSGLAVLEEGHRAMRK